jgi:hypothetical protein
MGHETRRQAADEAEQAEQVEVSRSGAEKRR